MKLGISILKEEEQKRNGDNAPVIIETEQHLRTVPCRLGRFNTFPTVRAFRYYYYTTGVCVLLRFLPAFESARKLKTKGEMMKNFSE